MAMYAVDCSNYEYKDFYNGYSGGDYSEYDGTNIRLQWLPSRASVGSIIRFNTPDFLGTSESLIVNLILSFCDYNAVVYCALSESDENWLEYATPSRVTSVEQLRVSEEYQIGSAEALCPALNVGDPYNTYGKYLDWTITIPTKSLKPNKTYYLFMRAYGEGTSGSGEHGEGVIYFRSGTNNVSMTLRYDKGLVYINDGTGVNPYQCYIDNGSGWDLVIPYIDNGSGWDMYT